MPQIINTNIASLTAQRNLNKSQSQYQTALTRLSSGLRINSAADDPAGLAIASRFQAQINGTGQAIKNANDGINLAQTAGSALSSITDNLQRIRELAVQSANDTNSSTDRQSLQQEVAQLQKEIQTTASTTNFNGKKLLDGSFQNQQFQVGANVGETISVSLNKVDASTLGTAQSAGISGQLSQSQLAGVATTGDVKLASGDLVINGTSVGASTATADTSSTVLQSSSAIAKAAAINAVSDQSGVTATANANTAEGNVVTAGTLATTSFSVSINGQSFTLSTTAPSSATSTDVQKQLQSVADQINQKQDATGVSATVVATTDSSGTAGYRIDLTAKDGRNIAISDTGTTKNTSVLGLASSAASNKTQVYVGTVSLSSKDGSNINLSTTTGNIDNAGFEAGSFSGVNGGAVADAGAYNSTSGSGRHALSSGDLVINGVSVGATSGTSDTASTADSSASGISLAAAINKVSSQTGVSATVNQNNVYGGSIAKLTSGTTYSVKINDVNISFTAGADTATTQSNLLSAVNQKSGQTGVTASALGSNQFTLNASDGRNIDIGNGDTSNSKVDLTTLGSADGTTSGAGTSSNPYILQKQDNIASVSLQSAGQFTLGSTTGNISNAGLNVGTFGGSESGTKISDINISTVSGANAAIKAVDNALNTISTNQATLGAVQNRFSATVSTLTSLSNNLTSAQSSIQDADFAKQTAALSRAQVLQQAGISILAQANAQPKQVLSLLQ